MLLRAWPGRGDHLYSALICRDHIALKITKPKKPKRFFNCEGNFLPKFLKNGWKEGLNIYWQGQERKYSYNIMKH